jgi:DNA gyrase/topoisomerase IV subunit A
VCSSDLLSEYKTQNRGGVGQKSAGTRDQDFLEHLFVATNHQYLLFFTQKGKCFWMRVYEIPEGTKVSKGRAIQNIINIEPDDKVAAYICTQDLKDQDYIKSHNLIMVTKQGQVKKTSLEKYSKPRVNGVAAITIKEGDELLGAKLTNVFSKEFTVSTCDGRNHLIQTYTNNMRDKTKPKVKPSTKSHTEISFIPDLVQFSFVLCLVIYLFFLSTHLLVLSFQRLFSLQHLHLVSPEQLPHPHLVSPEPPRLQPLF